jgi:hypothetical protein
LFDEARQPLPCFADWLLGIELGTRFLDTKKGLRKIP